MGEFPLSMNFYPIYKRERRELGRERREDRKKGGRSVDRVWMAHSQKVSAWWRMVRVGKGTHASIKEEL
jgi:hypothetical protein